MLNGCRQRRALHQIPKCSKAIFSKVRLQVYQLSKQNYFPIVPQMQCMIYHVVALCLCFYAMSKTQFQIRQNQGGQSHIKVELTAELQKTPEIMYQHWQDWQHLNIMLGEINGCPNKDLSRLSSLCCPIMCKITGPNSDSCCFWIHEMECLQLHR